MQSDLTIIESAYEDRIKDLFKVLFSNISSGGSSESNLERFIAGVKLAKEIKLLSIEALKQLT